MQTMKTTLKRGRNVWDKINLPEGEFRSRVDKVREKMEQENIDALLIYGSGPDGQGDPSYISNVVAYMGGTLAMVLKSGEVAVMTGGSARGLEYLQNTTWVTDVIPGADLAKECSSYLSHKNFHPSTIGLVGLKQRLPYAQLQSFYHAFNGMTFMDADPILRELRMIKTENECQQIQRASRIVTRVFGIAAGLQANNMGERDLDALLDREARLEGAEDFRMLIAKPLEENWAFRPVEDRHFASGETIVIYAAAQFERYWSESIRTFKVEGDHLVLPPMDAYFEQYSRVIEGLKPGKPVSQFYQETLVELEKNSFVPIMDYGLGQGIGQSLEEQPWISRESTIRLDAGNCLAFRLVIRDKTLGAVVFGDTVFLSAGGPQILTR